MKAFLFAAGKGTRLRPFTDYHPKALAKVNGKSLLQRNIEYLQSFGINDFVINIHHYGNQVLDFLKEQNNFGAHIEISDESRELLETGGALVFAKPFLRGEENILIMNTDILTDLDVLALVDFHESHQNFVSLAVSDRTSSRKLLFDESMTLKGWRNEVTEEEILAKDSQSPLQALAFSGIHCVSRQFLDAMTRTGKFSIMEEYLHLMNIHAITGYKHRARLIDVGKPEAIAQAEQLFQ